MSDEQEEVTEYLSYPALGRSPKVFGVPYMAGLWICCGALFVGWAGGTFINSFFWLFVPACIPVLLYVRSISETDDQAVRILLLEIKWALMKKMTGTSKYYGGTFTICPVSYGRKQRHVKRYFETFVQRERTDASVEFSHHGTHR